jgi:hypothetical protein
VDVAQELETVLSSLTKCDCISNGSRDARYQLTDLVRTSSYHSDATRETVTWCCSFGDHLDLYRWSNLTVNPQWLAGDWGLWRHDTISARKCLNICIPCITGTQYRGLIRIFGPETEDATAGRKELHDEELHNLYTSPNIIRTNKSRRKKWAGHVTRGRR